MLSKNASSVIQYKIELPDNQQERLKNIGWIIGYVDGEGCFSVSLFRNKTTKFGWQVFPEFVVTQGEKSKKSLNIIENFFKCGKIYVNKRYDNHNENIYRYCVRSKKELTEIIIPFFKKNQLKTAKIEDFNFFAKIVEMMNRNAHSNLEGMHKIAKLIEKMNHKKSSKFLESSETKC